MRNGTFKRMMMGFGALLLLAGCSMPLGNGPGIIVDDGDGDGQVECRINSDCASGQTCVDNECVDNGTECVLNSDCPNPRTQMCVDGDCVSRPDGHDGECIRNSDCTGGKICIDGMCTTPPDGVECARNADCAEGQLCVDGECVSSGPSNNGGNDDECDAHSDCGANELCIGGMCVEAQEPDDTQDPIRDLTVRAECPAGDCVAMMYNFCISYSDNDPTECDSWNEPGKTLFDVEYIQWSADLATTPRALRFNVSFFLEQADKVCIEQDASTAGFRCADDWLAYSPDNPQLAAPARIIINDEEFDVEDEILNGNGAVWICPYHTGASVCVDVDKLVGN